MVFLLFATTIIKREDMSRKSLNKNTLPPGHSPFSGRMVTDQAFDPFDRRPVKLFDVSADTDSKK